MFSIIKALLWKGGLHNQPTRAPFVSYVEADLPGLQHETLTIMPCAPTNNFWSNLDISVAFLLSFYIEHFL